MTREEAKIVLECMATDMIGAMAGMPETMPMLDVLRQRVDAINIALNALRPVSREQVEKVWRGCRSCKSCRSCAYSVHDLKDMPCKKCDPNAEGIVTEYKPSNFCPACGKPLTDEAVQMVMERMEALYEENRSLSV